MTKTVIKHFTRKSNLDAIKRSGEIRLEGCNMETIVHTQLSTMPSDIAFQTAQHWANMKRQYKLIGRYVWFTEQDHVHCTDPLQSCGLTPFEFEAEAIGAERWADVKQQVVRQRGKRAKRSIEMLELSAVLMGDNPELWWVSRRPVNLQLAA